MYVYICESQFLIGGWFVFLLKDSLQEGVITRDVHRTFPAHDYFKDSDGDGQESLYKICKVRRGMVPEAALSIPRA